MTTIHNRPRPLVPMAMCAILLMISSVPGRAQQSGNVSATWSLVGDEVLITYQLNAPRSKTYEVSVILKRETDPNFAVIPRAVSGDVGTGKFAAGARQIRWDYLKDIPEGLTGSGYWFEITANEVVEEGGSSWWIYAAGGAAAVTGAIVLLGGGGSDGGTPPPQTLPNPPSVRPTP